MANTIQESESPIPFPPFQKLKLNTPSPHVLEVVLNDAKGNNRWNDVMFNEFVECFRIIPSHPDIYCVVISAVGKHFTVGLDLNWAMKGNLFGKASTDAARTSLQFQRGLQFLQKSTDLVESCPVPVICAVHGAAVGMGIDLMTACDIRFAAKNAFFSVKEVDLGIVADVGSLARIPKIVGNTSLLRELVYTGRTFETEEAVQLGLISKVYDTQQAVRAGALEMAKEIASKSPVAVRGIKMMLNYEMSGKNTRELQEFVRILNGSLIQTQDIKKAGAAFFMKKKPTFSKL